MTNYQQKITFGELRAAGVRDVLVYCRTIVAAMSKSPPMAGLTTRQYVGHRARLRLYRLRQARRGGAAEVFARRHVYWLKGFKPRPKQQLDQRTALADQCLPLAEADVRPPRRIPSGHQAPTQIEFSEQF
jgi:hypothetical protein